MTDNRLLHLYNQFKPFFRYAVVGTLGTAIDLGSLYLLVEYAHLGVMFATTIAFVLAVINNFILNKIWTFENKHKNFRKQFVKFMLVSLVGLALTEGFMYFFTFIVGIWYLYAKAITSLIVLTWNFLGNKHWTFKDRVWDVFREEKYKHELSVVIPAYNEAKRISDTLVDVIVYLKAKFDGAEIIVVDDGSRDDTVKVVEGMKGHFANLQVISLEENAGKGAAVAEGVLKAEGEYILFMDADNSTRIDEVAEMLPLLDKDEADVVIGSRYLAKSEIKIGQPWYRVMIGRVGNRLIRTLLLDDIYDTQCGFKLFTNKAAKDLFQRMKINRFGFDMEILAIAQKVLEYRIKEMPVSWYDSADTRVRPIKAALKTFWELVWIKVNLMCGRYK